MSPPDSPGIIRLPFFQNHGTVRHEQRLPDLRGGLRRDREGRRPQTKCKKCHTALAVTDAGLVVDTPTGSPSPVAAAADDFDTGGEVVSPRARRPEQYSGPSGPGMGEMLPKIGGIPTILFGLGTFLVIWFTFMEPIGQAATIRAEARHGQARSSSSKSEAQEAAPEGEEGLHELNEDERKKYDEEAKKINEEYEKRSRPPEEDAASTRISNIRSVWFDKYGQLFGFVLLAFGCIGYLRTEQPLVMRIVAAVVLGSCC